MLDAVVSSGVQDEKIFRWLNHIQNAEKLWLERIRTGTFQTAPWEETGLEKLPAHMQATHNDIVAWLQSLSDTDLENGIASYTNTKGEAFQTTWIGILAHVANHSTHHRAQVAARLRDLGFAPPPTDYIFYQREEN